MLITYNVSMGKRKMWVLDGSETHDRPYTIQMLLTTTVLLGGLRQARPFTIIIKKGLLLIHRIFFLFPVYSTTAANRLESSYACYFDKKYNTYLGDVYSVKWMENSDKACRTIYSTLISKQFCLALGNFATHQ